MVMISANAHSTDITGQAIAPAQNFWRSALIVVVATAVASSLAVPNQANAHLSAELASGPIITTSDTSSDGMGSMPMEGMGSVMRPDMAPHKASWAA
jgi:hypothetical protein